MKVLYKRPRAVGPTIVIVDVLGLKFKYFQSHVGSMACWPTGQKLPRCEEYS